jgi:dipeptidyl aminopeptidase/acylaminoacyl peptidase
LIDFSEGIENFEFSPKEDKLLYTKRVKVLKTPAEIYPNLPKANVRIITDLMYRHWDKWTDEKRSHIFYSYFSMDKVVGEKDITPNATYDIPMSPSFDMSNIIWSSDGKKIFYATKKLTGREAALSTNSDIYCYDLSADNTENLTAGSLGYDLHPVISPDNTQLAWISMATPGYESDKKRLMVINLITKEVTEVTKNIENGAESACWASDSKSLFFIGGEKGSYQIFKFDSSQVTQLTQGAHDYTALSLQNNTLVGRKMSLSMAPELFAVAQDGQETQITFANKSIYEDVKMGKVEERWIRTVDYKQMLTWVVFPPDFDSTKKYPLLLYCQGGPQSAVSQFWSFRWNLQLWAAQGYIVVAPNRRGTPTFGQDWLKQISGDYSGLNIADYYSAIDEIKKEPYADPLRIGALGASYGGYSVFYLAGTHNKRFKAFAAHCGIFNLESMYGTTEEMFFVNYDMGGPYWSYNEKIRYNYRKSPHNMVDKWDTPIFISVGEHDYRVSYTEGLQAFNAAQLRGISSKLLFFPEETHFIAAPQNAVLWNTEMINWFDTYLK